MKSGFTLMVLMIALGVLWLWAGPAQADIVPPYDYYFTWDAGGFDIIKDAYNFGPPTWETGSKLWIPNLFTEEWNKFVWLEIVWTDPPPEPPFIYIETQPGIQIVDFPPVQGPDNDWTYKWGLHWQPTWERIIFPSSAYHNLTGGVVLVEVATWCYVPEPGTISLLAIAGLTLGVVAAARRRRKT